MDYCSQGQDHSEYQNVNLCPGIFKTAKHFVSKLDIEMHHHELEYLAKRLVCYFGGHSHSKSLYDQDMTVFYSFWTADRFATRLGFLVHDHKSECLRKKSDFCVQGQGHSIFQNVHECLSWWYLLNCWTFYYQTWYGDASLWAILSSKKSSLLSSRSRSQWRII